MLLIIGVVIVGGHIYVTHQKVEHAAGEAARAVSIARPVIAAAVPAARTAAEADMLATRLMCMSNISTSPVAAFPPLPPGSRPSSASPHL